MDEFPKSLVCSLVLFRANDESERAEVCLF